MSNFVRELNVANFDETIGGDTVCLVDFWATWCGPCKMLAPVLETLAEETVGKVNVCKVDVDPNEELARRFKITSVPTLIVFKKGEKLEQFSGVRTKSQMLSILEKYL